MHIAPVDSDEASEAGQPLVVVAAGSIVALAVTRQLRGAGLRLVAVADIDEFNRHARGDLHGVIADVEVGWAAEVLAMARYLASQPVLVALADSPALRELWERSAFVVSSTDDVQLGLALRSIFRHSPQQ